jgi:uncharacterized protein
MKKVFKFLLRSILVLFVLLNIVVIFHAYKFTHYYEAGTLQQKKQEDKTGWDITKEMLFGMNMEKQQNAVPDSSFTPASFTTSDGIKLDAIWQKVDSSKGTIAMFHGHGSKKTAILAESNYFNSLGFSTLLVDLRAHGNSQGSTCTIGFKESRDVKAAYDYLANTGEKNIILYGISLGAATVIKAAADFNIAPKKIIAEMPFSSLPKAVHGRVKIMGLPPQPIATLLTFWGGTINGFWAFGMKPMEYAKKLKCPVLLQKGRQDPRVTDEETNEIYNNITSPKKLVIYENSSHESLCSKETTKWQAEISSFLQQ